VWGAQLRGRRFDVVEIHEPLAAGYALLARLVRPRLPACAVLSFGLTDRFWAAERAHLRVYGRRPRASSRVLVPLTLLSQARVAVLAAEAVVVPSTADRDHLVRHVGVPENRVSCAFTGRPEVAGEIDGTPPHADVRVLFLGTWIERKGTLELVAAWRRLSRERGHVRLTLAGVGDADAARAAVHGLARVDLIPTVGRDELPAMLAAHEVFVLPSWFEGMPLSMLEAAAAGLACVVSAVCGNLDVFRPDDPRRDGALLVPPNDPDALYRALLTVVDDDSLRSALGRRARERAREFTWGRNAEQTLDAFASAVDRHRELHS
jgi:glycosyltransferase involved in cell wall biosynthesis